MKKILVAAIAIVYFCTLSWLSFGVPHVFTSPDENANFTFASTFAATGDLVIKDGVNALLHGALHPRSTVVLGTLTLPGSFVGWPMIVGSIGAITSFAGGMNPALTAMLLVTPILVMLALAAWWGIARRLGPSTGSGSSSDVRFAWIATALLALHPAFWYYASRGMMHNVPFVCVLIIAVWLVQRKVKSEKEKVGSGIARIGLAGLLVGIALCIRTNEALWVLPLAMLLVYKCETSQRAVSTAIRIAALLVGITIPLIGLGAVNAHLYGSPFATGYTTTTNYELRTTNDETQALAPAAIEVRSSPFEALLPFGFHPRAMVKNVWHYGVALFPWMTVIAVAGMGIVLRASSHHPQPLLRQEGSRSTWRTLLWVTLGLATWLGVVYGSWSFHDNPDPTAMTIGDSHLRYWLPLFVLSTLFAARAICSFARAKDVPAGRLYATVPLIAIATLSSILVFGGDDGLVHTRQVLFASAAKRDGVMAATEDNAIIVVDRADKFLFPYRRVLQPLRSDATYAVLADAEKLAPLYYYGIPFPETDMTYLNDVKLASLGLRIDVVQAIGDETLYRISERPLVPQGGN